MNDQQQALYERLSPAQRALVDKCIWCETNGASRGAVNDVQWMLNRAHLSSWGADNGYTQKQISDALVWTRKRFV